MKLRDLDWVEETPDRIEARTRVGGYTILPDTNELWFETSRTLRKREMLARGGIDGLKGVAMDHYKEQIMWAFDVDTPPN
jgi:hypothetical protein